MDFNIIGYIAFGVIIYFTTIHLGLVFHRNGRHYMLQLFQSEAHLVDGINNLLLVGYYLLNLGYASLSIVYWPDIHSMAELIECVAYRSGLIIVALGFMHFFNMFWLLMYSYYHARKAAAQNKKKQLSN